MWPFPSHSYLSYSFLVLKNIEADKLRTRVDTNNEIIRIIVIIDDEETAEKIRDKINVAIDEHNEEGIVRHSKSARAVVNEKNLSPSCGTMLEQRIIVMFLMVLTFLIRNNIW